MDDLFEFSCRVSADGAITVRIEGVGDRRGIDAGQAGDLRFVESESHQIADGPLCQTSTRLLSSGRRGWDTRHRHNASPASTLSMPPHQFGDVPFVKPESDQLPNGPEGSVES